MTTAAPGVTKEVEDAISLYRLAVCNDLQNITHERVAARAALLAAIEKHVSDALAASRAENATLQAELAMATDAANKGDDARTKAGAMQDQISDLRNIVAGMFWAGGSIDDKTMGDIRALGLDCRAENAALAKLADELSVDHRDDDTFDAGVRYALFILGFEKEAVEANDASKALRAGQQKG
jgi:hypothetical protein